MARRNDREKSRRIVKETTRRTKKRPCIFCRHQVDWVDYRDIALLTKFMSERGKIRARRVTGNCAQHQHDIAMAIKTARELALLPYTQRTTGERTQNHRRYPMTQGESFFEADLMNDEFISPVGMDEDSEMSDEELDDIFARYADTEDSAVEPDMASGYEARSTDEGKVPRSSTSSLSSFSDALDDPAGAHVSSSKSNDTIAEAEEDKAEEDN